MQIETLNKPDTDGAESLSAPIFCVVATDLNTWHENSLSRFGKISSDAAGAVVGK